MRIARTTGVSDAVVKPRRGISLRTVREEPKKPEKIKFGVTPELMKAIKGVGNSMEGARNAVDNFATAFSEHLAFSNPPRNETIRFRTEEIPEDRRVHRYNLRDLGLRVSPMEAQDMVSEMAGPVPDGYTRTFEWSSNFSGEFMTVFDHRPRRMVRIPEVPQIAMDMGDPNGDIGVVEFRVPYEVLEDIDGGVSSDIRRFDNGMSMMFWRHVANRLGWGDISAYTRVETMRNIQDRTISVRFTTR